MPGQQGQGCLKKKKYRPHGELLVPVRALVVAVLCRRVPGVVAVLRHLLHQQDEKEAGGHQELSHGVLDVHVQAGDHLENDRRACLESFFYNLRLHGRKKMIDVRFSADIVALI